jgi:isoamyl acetate esterase
MARPVPFCVADFDSVEKSMANDLPRIYLFGDSLTERAFYEQERGFGSHLRRYYEGRRVGIVNRGKGEAP